MAVDRAGVSNTQGSAQNKTGMLGHGHSPQLWIASFAAWTFIASGYAVSQYLVARSAGQAVALLDQFKLPLINNLIFAFLAPWVFVAAIRHPLRRQNWRVGLLAHFAGGCAYSVLHVVLRALVWTVYAPAVQQYIYILIDWRSLTFNPHWALLGRMLLYNFVDDIAYMYFPVVVVAHSVLYYQTLRERELRASQLEAQVARAHLESLKSQLQPHFLFNTLHSISALMLIDVHSADRMMTLLSDLLRMSLGNGDLQITTLQRELEFVTKYLEIEKVRFGDRLHVVLDVAPETLDADVPHLLLQPLVENAVRHGIARLSASGEIRISTSLNDCGLRLLVRDNGPGLEDADTGQPGTGLGLKATQQRLQTLYGGDQQLTIRDMPEGGVEVCVQIPLEVSTEPPAMGIVAEDLDPSARQIQGAV